MRVVPYVLPPSVALGFAAAAAVTSGRVTSWSVRPDYPVAPRAAVVDDYHGTPVPDPYRWLEDAEAPETVRWVEAQNALTRSMLDGDDREAIRKRLQELYDYPRVSVPEKHGNRYFYTRNTGLQNQSVLYVREGLAGPERVLLDPNVLSDDGTVALTGYVATRDGALLAYTLSRSGSDRQEIYVRDVVTGRDRPDRLLWSKFTSLAWTPDGAGFYYTRFPQPGSVPAGDESYYSRVHHHRLGDAQEKDLLVYERPDHKEQIFAVQLTRDGRFLVITAFMGSADSTEVRLLDRREKGAKPSLLFEGFEHSYLFVDEVGGRFFFQTNAQAPLGRVIAVDVGRGETRPIEVLPQSKHKLASSAVVSDTLVAVHLQDASHRMTLHGLDGRERGRVELPALGSVSALTGEPPDREMFVEFTSYTYPTTSYRYDFEAGALTPFEKPSARIDTAAYETDQVFFSSKDGTKVPMFVVHKKGLPRDGRRPTLLTGYGGFNVSVTPEFSPKLMLWLERGGVLAEVNLRGGGEYGEEWHRAGMLEKKQNVFDDFTAAAERLVASGYTSREKLAIQGGSNGGLLVGAALVQRPELFGAAVCQVPVADMLRYHLFTVGRYWIPEYGSSEDPKQFPFLHAYSPYHRVQDGVAYPATLVTTADTDDRVAPGLAKKFGARLQAATAGTDPILVRVETKAGHGSGKPVSKVIDEAADVYTFLFRALGEMPAS